MQKINHVLLVIFMAMLSFQCQKDLSTEKLSMAQVNNQSSPLTATLQGNVVDENGQPAAGVKISAGAKTTITNTRGYFRITDASLDKNTSVVTAEHTGYFKAYRSFRATSGVNQVVIKLIPKKLAGTINSVSGGEARLANGAKISLASNSIGTASGGNYTGDIKVYAAYIDPSLRDIGNIIPGSFMADDKNNNRVVLTSYGMLAVELESSAGEKLQVKAGSTAQLTTPIPPTFLQTAPVSIACWYMDELSGIWKEEGTATRNGSNYISAVKHFSYWNCDFALPAISLSANFKTSTGLPLTNLYVRVNLLADTSNGCAHGYTDSLGEVSGLVPANKSLLLQVLDGCSNVVYSKEIGPFTNNTNLGIIIIPAGLANFYTINGKLLTCNNTAVTKGYAMIYWNNLAYTVNADDNGQFSFSFFDCSGAPSCEIIAVDKTTQQQGAVLTIPVTGKLTNVGSITACGISSTEFINYTVDGIDYTLSLQSDSIRPVMYSFQMGTLFETYMNGYNINSGNTLRYNFTGNAQPGSYPLKSLTVNSYDRIGLTTPLNIVIARFPQHAGDFYEGNFSGSFKDSSAIATLHTIDCTFRIKRNF